MENILPEPTIVLCVNEDVTFTAVTKPSGFEKYVDWSGGGEPANKTDSATFTTKYSEAKSDGYNVTASLDTSSVTRHVWVMGGEITGPTSICLHEEVNLKAALGQPSLVKYLWDKTGSSIKLLGSISLRTSSDVNVRGLKASRMVNDSEVSLRYKWTNLKECIDTHKFTVCYITASRIEKGPKSTLNPDAPGIFRAWFNVQGRGLPPGQQIKVTVTKISDGPPEPIEPQIVTTDSKGFWTTSDIFVPGAYGKFKAEVTMIAFANCSDTLKFKLP